MKSLAEKPVLGLRAIIIGLVLLCSASWCSWSYADEIDANAFIVTMSVTITSINPPTIKGKTNLPDGTALTAGISAEIPCPACGFGFLHASVKDGAFIFVGPRALDPENVFYTIEIIGYPRGASNVQSILGEKGEHLAGPHIFTGLGPIYVPLRLSQGSYSDKTFGRIVRYIQKIMVPSAREFRLLPPTEAPPTGSLCEDKRAFVTRLYLRMEAAKGEALAATDVRRGVATEAERERLADVYRNVERSYNELLSDYRRQCPAR